MGNGEIVLLIKRYSMGGSRGKSGGPYPPPPLQKLCLESPPPPMANANNCRNPLIRAWVEVSIYH